MRRFLAHLLALPGGRVARAYRGADSRERPVFGASQIGDPRERHVEVLVNVVAECLQRRNVENLRAVWKFALARLQGKFIEGN